MNRRPVPWKRCKRPGCNGYAGSGETCPAHKAQAERLARGYVQPIKSARGFPRGSGAVVGTT